MSDSKGVNLREALQIPVEEWSNKSCMGYAIAACRRAGVERNKIDEIIGEFKWIFDTISLEDAKKIYQDY